MAGLDPTQRLEDATSALANVLKSLPPQLLEVTNTTNLANELVAVSQSLSPILKALSPALTDSLLTNLTFVKENIESLDAALSNLPRLEVERSTPDQLVELIVIGSTKFSLGTVWAPEVWAVLFVFIYAALTKVTLWALVPRKFSPVERGTSESLCEIENYASTSRSKEGDAALRLSLDKKARLIFRHGFNIFVSTFILILQLISYRTFSVPETSLNLQDFKRLSAAAKLVVLPYGLELVYNQPHNHIWAHHIFTFMLILIGQFTANQTKDVLFFRLLQWWILQASTEQSMYLAMLSYHSSEYLRLRRLHPRFEKRLLLVAARSMRFTSWITYPQKFIPICFATYWLARMWAEEDTYSALGRFWLAWCVLLLTLLVLMQVWFCEEAFAISSNLNAKLKGEIPSLGRGPLGTLFHSRLQPLIRPRVARGSTTFRSAEYRTLLENATAFQWPLHEDMSSEWSSTITLEKIQGELNKDNKSPSELYAWNYN